MDDIRRPQHLKRRDYAIPAGRPAHLQPGHSPSGRHPEPPQPAPHHPHPPAAQRPINHRPADSLNPHPAYHHTPQPTAQPYQPARPPAAAPATAASAPETRHKRLLGGKRLSLAAAVVVAGLAIFGAGYLLKGSNDSQGIPASITRQVNYDLYFPSPMPQGYIYMKDTATFQIGQVFYKFANGKKRVTVNEQPMPDPKPNLAKLPGYTQFSSSVGPAAIGTDLGEPTAVILTPTTVITMHCVGGVSPDDLKAAISSLKNIGSNSQKT